MIMEFLMIGYLNTTNTLTNHYSEITRLFKDDSIPIDTSPLFKMLVQSQQNHIQSLEKNRNAQVRYLWKCYYEDEFGDAGHRVFNYIHQYQYHSMKRFLNTSADFMKTDEFCIQFGTDYLIGFFVHSLFLRYHQQLEIPPFLIAFRTQKDTFTIHLGKCLLMSRLNFILHGVYLPVVAFLYGEAHTNAMLFIPVMKNDDDDDDGDSSSHCTWRIVFIDSDINSSSVRFDAHVQTRSHYEPHAIMKWFQEKLVNQRDNIVNYDFSYCTEEIQKALYFRDVGGGSGTRVDGLLFPDCRIKSGNCAIWAHLMAFHILRHFDTLNSRSTQIDYINVYCKYFDDRVMFNLSNRKKFHDFAMHFKTAVYHYAKDLSDRVSTKIDPMYFMVEILHGPQTPVINLIIQIFNDFDASMHEFLNPIDIDENLQLKDFEIHALNRRIAKLKTAKRLDPPNDHSPVKTRFTSHTSVFPDVAIYKEPVGHKWEEDRSEPDYDKMFPNSPRPEYSDEDDDDDVDDNEDGKSSSGIEGTNKLERKRKKEEEFEKLKEEWFKRRRQRQLRKKSHMVQDKMSKADRLMMDLLHDGRGRESSSAKRHKS